MKAKQSSKLSFELPKTMRLWVKAASKKRGFSVSLLLRQYISEKMEESSEPK